MKMRPIHYALLASILGSIVSGFIARSICVAKDGDRSEQCIHPTVLLSWVSAVLAYEAFGQQIQWVVIGLVALVCLFIVALVGLFMVGSLITIEFVEWHVERCLFRWMPTILLLLLCVMLGFWLMGQLDGERFSDWLVK
jgi:hypothetical protein